MKFIRSVVPHLTIAVALVMITLNILDLFVNDAMKFIDNPIFKYLCLGFSVLAVITSIFLISRNRRAVRKKYAKEMKKNR